MLPFISGWLGKAAVEPSRSTNPSKALLSSLLMMAWFVEARDPYTGGHLWRVSRYARLLAEKVVLAPTEN